ncbi:stage V sporulation protein AE [Bacillus sp. FJAT-44742]|uniref:stage V sporulation protein AE n=1 Tax=Bacillus sp. FJAT-44742 TaxID=2014005 RepID=UPI000C24CAC3|nr:stage V sporulation protein AE [Bacillus sp. FJAT-44742]
MSRKKSVIFITDGDSAAVKAVECAARELQLPFLTASGGNPSPPNTTELEEMVKSAEGEPVLLLFDDAGQQGIGRGEEKMIALNSSKTVDVLGVIAVASTSKQFDWTNVDVSIDKFGNLTSYGVDKEGIEELEIGRLKGDTVYCIDDLGVPVIGVGDIGKMGGWDDPEKGSPITRKAIEILIERSGWNCRNK